MTTKEQERQAIEKIRKIVEGLGENSYVGFAMEGVLELAEDNIREDTAYSMKKNAEIAWEREDKAEKENKDLKKEVEDLKKTVEKGVQEAERKPEQIQESDGGTGQERKTKGRKRMRKKYYHAATPETMKKIIADGVVKRGWDG